MNAVEERALRHLLEDLGYDRAVFARLVRTFLDDAPRLLADARRQASGGDPEGCRRSIHTLKALSATFGARQLAARCREHEKDSRAGLMPSAEQFRELERLWDAARPELDAAAAA